MISISQRVVLKSLEKLKKKINAENNSDTLKNNDAIPDFNFFPVDPINSFREINLFCFACF